ncbi:MAG: methytransferase partner Trm112 [Methanomassiliicoccales archaeon]
MRRRVLDVLACPICKHSPLELTVHKEDEKEILEGYLRCPRCQINYPIEDGIPNMIPPQNQV